MAIQPEGRLQSTDATGYYRPALIKDKLIETMIENDALLRGALSAVQYANSNSSHHATIETDIADAEWVGTNEGTHPSKGATSSFDFTVAMLESLSEVSIKDLRLNNFGEIYYESQIMPHVKKMSRELGRTLLYGNRAYNLREFTGFFPLLNTLKKTTNFFDSVIDGGAAAGTTNNASILLVNWDVSDGCYGIVPQGMPTGLEIEDPKTEERTDRGNYEVSITRFRQFMGLGINNTRSVVRIANIDTTKLSKDPTAAGSVNLIQLLISAYHKMRNYFMPGKTQIYMPPLISEILDFQQEKSENLRISYGEIDGRPKLSFRGAQINIIESMSLNESAVQ